MSNHLEKLKALRDQYIQQLETAQADTSEHKGPEYESWLLEQIERLNDQIAQEETRGSEALPAVSRGYTSP